MLRLIKHNLKSILDLTFTTEPWGCGCTNSSSALTLCSLLCYLFWHHSDRTRSHDLFEEAKMAAYESLELTADIRSLCLKSALYSVMIAVSWSSNRSMKEINWLFGFRCYPWKHGVYWSSAGKPPPRTETTKEAPALAVKAWGKAQCQGTFHSAKLKSTEL